MLCWFCLCLCLWLRVGASPIQRPPGSLIGGRGGLSYTCRLRDSVKKKTSHGEGGWPWPCLCPCRCPASGGHWGCGGCAPHLARTVSPPNQDDSTPPAFPSLHPRQSHGETDTHTTLARAPTKVPYPPHTYLLIITTTMPSESRNGVFPADCPTGE